MFLLAGIFLKGCAFSAACLIFSFLSLSTLAFPTLAIEDVANLTASDVMNRVNLGYLQGKSTRQHCCCSPEGTSCLKNTEMNETAVIMMFWSVKQFLYSLCPVALKQYHQSGFNRTRWMSFDDFCLRCIIFNPAFLQFKLALTFYWENIFFCKLVYPVGSTF